MNKLFIAAAAVALAATMASVGQARAASPPAKDPNCALNTGNMAWQEQYHCFGDAAKPTPVVDKPAPGSKKDPNCALNTGNMAWQEHYHCF